MRASAVALVRSLLVLAVLALSSGPAARASASGEPLVIETLGTYGAGQSPPVIDDDGDPRVGAGMAAVDADTILYYGGFVVSDEDGERAAGDAWLLEGDTWRPLCGTQIAGADQPCPPGVRALPAVGELPGGGVIVYGGSNGWFGDSRVGFLADTWIYDGLSWTPVCGTAVPGADHPCGPGARGGSSILDTSGGTYLFGGGRDDTAFNDVWRFNGSSWERVNDGSGIAPAPRAMAQAATDGAGAVLFGGMTPPDDEQALKAAHADPEVVYTPSPSPLSATVALYTAAASPLSYGGTDYTSTGGLGSGTGAVYLAAGEPYQAVAADSAPLSIPTGEASRFHVALLDFGAGQYSTYYIEAAVFDQYGLTPDCGGTVQLVSGLAGGAPVTCDNFKPGILTQPGIGTNFGFTGYGGFQNGGPVAEVNSPQWSPGIDPFISRSGSNQVHFQGPCCGASTPGAQFAVKVGPDIAWIDREGIGLIGLFDGHDLSAVDVATVSVNGAKVTIYVSARVFTDGAYSEDCAGLLRMSHTSPPSPSSAPTGCANFKRGIFTPRGVGADYNFTGFGGFSVPNPISEAPAFQGDGLPYLRYLSGGGGSSEPGLPADTWSWDPGTNTWTPRCGTTHQGASAPCGPPGRVLSAFAPVGSLDPSNAGVLMAGGMVPPSEGDSEAPVPASYSDPHAPLPPDGDSDAPVLIGDIWLWSGGSWRPLDSPWVSLDPNKGDRPPPEQIIPLALLGATVSAGCYVAGYGLDSADFSQSDGEGEPRGITLAFGFDTTGEGEIDPCAQDTNTPGPGDPQELAFTGAPSRFLIVLGGSFVLLGVVAMTLRRRRA